MRVVTHTVAFADFIDRGSGALARYASADMIAGLRFIDMLGGIARRCGDPVQDRPCRTHLATARFNDVELIAPAGG